jgi:hypothetical protein
MIQTLIIGLVLSLHTLPAFSGVADESRDPHVATVTQVEGGVDLFTNPTKTLPPGADPRSGTLALFEGSYYRVRGASSGDRVENGNVLRAAPGARAKVVYDNGDQLFVGPGSAYRVVWNEPKASASELSLMYGKLRGVIKKEKGEKKFIIKTRTAVMGVRGTDFYISDEGVEGETEIAVIRGRVEVETAKGLKDEVVTGGAARVKDQVFKSATTKELLEDVKVASSIHSGPPVEQMRELEAKALNTAFEDIRLYQPAVYQKLRAQLGETLRSEDLNAKVVEIEAEKAPSDPKRKRIKPSSAELKDVDQKNSYDQYLAPAKAR